MGRQGDQLRLVREVYHMERRGAASAGRDTAKHGDATGDLQPMRRCAAKLQKTNGKLRTCKSCENKDVGVEARDRKFIEKKCREEGLLYTDPKRCMPYRKQRRDA